MSGKIIEFCKKCNLNTDHRFVNDRRENRTPYWSCAICLGNNSKKYRKRHWCKYLAKKANSRKVPNSVIITEELLKNMNDTQQSKCALSGIQFDIESKWWRPSLDRIDSDKGYIPENIRLVAWIVNHSRGELTDNEFIDMVLKIANYHIFHKD